MTSDGLPDVWEMTNDELPGMWEVADFRGGETDQLTPDEQRAEMRSAADVPTELEDYEEWCGGDE